MTKKKIHIVSYSHWDREVRFDFETTRMWLDTVQLQKGVFI